MFRRAPAPLCLILLLAMLLPAPLRAAGVELVYDLHAGGFHLGAATATVTVEGGRYRVENEMETRGFVGWMTGFTSVSSSEGRLRPDAAAPAAHRSDNLWRGKERSVRVRFAGPVPEVAVRPPAAEDERPAVPPQALVGAVDPLSAALTLALAAEGPPGRTVAVFDGRRRYDLIVAAIAPDTLKEPGFSGPGRRMLVQWRRVAGYAPAPWFMPSNMPDEGTVWFAPPSDASLGLWLPVRVMADSPFGTGVIRLVGMRRLP